MNAKLTVWRYLGYMLIASVVLVGLGGCDKIGTTAPSKAPEKLGATVGSVTPCFLVVGKLGDVDAELFSASAAGNLGRMRQAMEDGGNPNAADALSRTPLFATAFCNQSQAADLILDRGGNIDARDFTGMSPLHAAIIAGSEGVASTLIARGANINLQNNSGRTPLHLAAATDQIGLVELLLNHAASVQLRDKNGATASSLALANGNSKTVSAIKTWRQKHKPTSQK